MAVQTLSGFASAQQPLILARTNSLLCLGVSYTYKTCHPDVSDQRYDAMQADYTFFAGAQPNFPQPGVVVGTNTATSG